MISQIRNAQFRTTRFRPGYDERLVDDFLDSLVRVLGDGGSLDPSLLRDAHFPSTRLRPGYEPADVDGLLDVVEQYAAEYR
jgi:DivIVA domain-containing protein